MTRGGAREVAVPSSQNRSMTMYLVLFLDNATYDFTPSLHSSLPAAEAAYKDLVRQFGVKKLDLGFGDEHGEEPRVYRIECDGKLGKESTRDLATA
jgi:hypothetical protein